MADLTVNNQSDLLVFIKENLTNDKNLSTRGLARLCGVQDTALIRGADFKSQKLGQKLIEHGFKAADLVKNGFDAKACWLVIEYYAYESKATALGAKQIARTFGQIGLMTTFDKLTEVPVLPEVPVVPKTALELAKEQVKLLEQLELQQAVIASLQEESERQAEVIDELYDYSSIIRIAKYNSVPETNFNWRMLKVASQKLGTEIKRVDCPRFGTKNLYSHDAWRLAYPDVNLPEITTLVIKPLEDT
jgi:hypothetical protein